MATHSTVGITSASYVYFMHLCITTYIIYCVVVTDHTQYQRESNSQLLNSERAIPSIIKTLIMLVYYCIEVAMKKITT